MCGLSCYLISFDYDFDTYVWSEEQGCYIGQKTGNKKKWPCNYSSNYKYTSEMPESWREVWGI